MKELTAIFCATIGLLVFRVEARAWSDGGHMVIAAEAYRELPITVKTRVLLLLKSHPEYKKWAKGFGSSNLDLGTYIFMRASTWPDELRSRHTAQDHPGWHYINYPLKSASLPTEPEPSSGDDILEGIRKCEEVLGNSQARAEERAVHLSWLIHLIGDLHQPLHCCALASDAAGSGEKDDFYVKSVSCGVKLPVFWDGLLGVTEKPQAHLSNALQIQLEHPRKCLPELTAATTTKAWSLESRSLAIERGYLGGELKGGASAESAAALPEGYAAAAKVVAEKQAALAGYRLADVVREYFN